MKIPARVQPALDGCGLPWRIEYGSRHVKIMVGEQLAGVLPRSGCSEKGSADRKTAAQINRLAKAVKPGA